MDYYVIIVGILGSYDITVDCLKFTVKRSRVIYLRIRGVDTRSSPVRVVKTKSRKIY
jgi:hypothetical protein